MEKSYKDKPTISDGKVKSTQFALEKSLLCNENEIGIFTVGCASGLIRHIKDKNDLGLIDDNLIVVERNKQTFDSLCEMAKTIDFKGKVIYGDMLDIVIELYNKGLLLGHVDFDSVSNYSRYTDNLISFCISINVKNIHIITASRSSKESVEYMTYLSDKLSIPRVRKIRYNRGYVDDAINTSGVIIPIHLKSLYDNYSVNSMSYRGIGRTPMVITILQRELI